MISFGLSENIYREPPGAIQKFFLNSEFANRIDDPGRMIVLAGFVAIVIALLTISLHAHKAGIANPVKALRTK